MFFFINIIYTGIEKSFVFGQNDSNSHEIPSMVPIFPSFEEYSMMQFNRVPIPFTLHLPNNFMFSKENIISCLPSLSNVTSFRFVVPVIVFCIHYWYHWFLDNVIAMTKINLNTIILKNNIFYSKKNLKLMNNVNCWKIIRRKF